MRRTRCHWAPSKGSTTRSASSNDEPMDFEMRSTSASKSSLACCQKSKKRPEVTHSLWRRTAADTVGEFVRGVWKSEFSSPANPILPKFQLIDHQREFAN